NPGPRTHKSSRQEVRRTVLLVEDNAVNQEVAKAMLEALNCDVHSAWNGREALEIIRQKTFDAVLMDCQMPELDGYAATLSLREWEKRHQRPRMAIIALTANALESDEQKCLDAGMDAYVSKPFTMEQLRQALDRFAPGPAPARALAG
ncbi:MAG: response regulator, partial [Gammaproteobacteria bacterium]|nr:response regulator [Gammaproteobacteria bacterium]